MSSVVLDTRLSSVLASGQVEIGFHASDAGEAAERLLRPLLLREGFSEKDADAALEAVRQRERTGSTNCGSVALPHARLAGLSRIVGALGLNPGGVYEGSSGTRLVLAFASPAQNAVVHLKFLGQVAQVFRQDDLVEQLLGAADAPSLLAALRAREK